MRTTFPQLLLKHADERPGHAALREKEYGIWQQWSWLEFLQLTERMAAGLLELGLARGDHIAIIGENRPHLYAALFAVQSIGGVPVPLYQDAVANEYVFPLNNAQVRFAFVEDQEQVDKLLEIRDKIATLENIFVDDTTGLRHYREDMLLTVDKLETIGRDYQKQHPDFFRKAVANVQADDVAALFFTSGTTGNPKGVVHTFSSLLAAAQIAAEFDRLTGNEEVLAYLPLAWIGQNIFSVAQFILCGYTVNCPESSSTTAIDMREIGPTYYFAPPRVFEALLTQVTIRMEDAGWLKRKWFAWAMAVASDVGVRRMDGATLSASQWLRYKLADATIFGPLRNTLGLSRVRVAYTAGEAVGPDLFRFYRSIGINLKQLYGSTETAVFVCSQPDTQVFADTVGPPLPGVQIQFSAEGEIQVKSPGLFQSYYKNPEATAASINQAGWFMTGDAGYIDERGHLKIIDRAKDVGKLANGTLFAPKYLENKLKFFPFIKEVVAFGDQQEMVCALVNIDFEAVGNWAERRSISYAGYTDLASRDLVYDLVADCVSKVNRDLSLDSHMSGAQIQRFLILHKELDPDDDELTRTRKVRRGFIGEKYKVLVDALFAGSSQQYIETQVKFEDGRSGVISANIAIRDAQTFPTKAAA